jgi:hypothetical protein
LLDSGLRIWSRIGVSRSAYNESYPEPDGRSGTHVPINFLRDSQKSMMFSTYLNLRNVSAFQLKSSTNRKSWWNPISLMLNIPSEFLIKKKEALAKRWLRCIKFSGHMTLKKKPPGRRRIISTDNILVFSTLPQVSLYLPPFFYPISGRDSF